MGVCLFYTLVTGEEGRGQRGEARGGSLYVGKESRTTIFLLTKKQQRKTKQPIMATRMIQRLKSGLKRHTVISFGTKWTHFIKSNYSTVASNFRRPYLRIRDLKASLPNRCKVLPCTFIQEKRNIRVPIARGHCGARPSMCSCSHSLGMGTSGPSHTVYPMAEIS